MDTNAIETAALLFQHQKHIASNSPLEEVLPLMAEDFISLCKKQGLDPKVVFKSAFD
jgi:hypothetical protein